MDADEQRMRFFENFAKLGGDPLRQKDRDARADANEFDVRNGPELAQKVSQLIVAEQQRVAAAEKNVANGPGAPNVIELLLELRMKVVPAGITHQARARAVSAIRRTPVGHQEQNAVRI